MKKIFTTLAMLCTLATLTTAADFYPVGVYWPGEFTFHDQQIPKLRWQKIEQTLNLLASNHVNTIWLTHVDAVEGAKFATLAGKRGIRLVASLGELAGENPGARKGDQIATVLKTWGDAPKPLAWGLGDEPRAEYMAEMGTYAAAWKKAGQPVTSVVMAGDIVSCAVQMQPTFLCADIYPFFSANNPNGPGEYAASTTYYLDTGHSAQKWTKGEWWMMGQIFSEVWGRRDVDEKGNIVYLPGGGPHWRMPTPAEVRWQTWAAAATGARGVIYFSLFFNVGPELKCEPMKSSFAVKEVTPSGLPASILYMDGRPTPLLGAMGDSFASLQKVAGILKHSQPTDQSFAFTAKGWRPAGQVVQPFIGEDGAWYVAVVSGDFENEAEVAVNVATEITGVTDLVTGQPLELLTKSITPWEAVGPFKQVRVKLTPGNGTLLRLQKK